MAVRRPPGLRARGARFWRTVTSAYELGVDELELLEEVCRLLDQLDALRAAVDADGLIVEGSKHQPRVHPAVPQANATRATLRHLVGALGLPDPDGDQVPTATTVRARKAAQTRWARRQRERDEQQAATGG